mmetsp:Transcript_3908/g.11232  ORF Transcript_3908/g.11232 Transcript_3908/m.11232 type:complete len:217 (-) Transcript_3908:175-825(-)
MKLGDQLTVDHGLLSKTNQRARLRVGPDLDRGEGGSVRLQSLAPLLLHGVQLHETLHKLWPVRRAWCDSDENAPLLVRGNHVLDDLASVEVRRPVELLLRGRVSVHVPVIDGRGGNDTNLRWTDPLPEHNLIRHLMASHLSLRVEVEHLEVIRSLTWHSSLQCNDLAVRVHQGRVSSDRSSHGLHRRRHVHDHNIVCSTCSCTHLTHADVLFAFHC